MSEGVLVMGFGGPKELGDVPEFCANLMGREPSAEVIERVTRRYLTIGGGSPLPGIAASIAHKLSEKIERDGKQARVEFGFRYSPPFIGDAVRALAEAGTDRLVTVSLSPFESAHSSGAYRHAVILAAAHFPDLTFVEAPSFRKQPSFLDALASSASDALTEVSGSRKALIFTAHSLPVDEIGEAPYVEQLCETANGVAVRLGLPVAAAGSQQTWLPGIEAFGADESGIPWLLAFQSKGQRPGAWLAPDVSDVVKAIAEAGFESVVFSPIGFATDHLETLYDLDVEACGLALDLGMDFQRATVPNDGLEMIEALAGVVEPLLTVAR